MEMNGNKRDVIPRRAIKKYLVTDKLFRFFSDFLPFYFHAFYLIPTNILRKRILSCKDKY